MGNDLYHIIIKNKMIYAVQILSASILYVSVYIIAWKFGSGYEIMIWKVHFFIPIPHILESANFVITSAH